MFCKLSAEGWRPWFWGYHERDSQEPVHIKQAVLQAHLTSPWGPTAVARKLWQSHACQGHAQQLRGLWLLTAHDGVHGKDRVPLARHSWEGVQNPLDAPAPSLPHPAVPTTPSVTSFRTPWPSCRCLPPWGRAPPPPPLSPSSSPPTSAPPPTPCHSSHSIMQVHGGWWRGWWEAILEETAGRDLAGQTPRLEQLGPH